MTLQDQIDRRAREAALRSTNAACEAARAAIRRKLQELDAPHHDAIVIEMLEYSAQYAKYAYSGGRRPDVPDRITTDYAEQLQDKLLEGIDG